MSEYETINETAENERFTIDTRSHKYISKNQAVRNLLFVLTNNERCPKILEDILYNHLSLYSLHTLVNKKEVKNACGVHDRVYYSLKISN